MDRREFIVGACTVAAGALLFTPRLPPVRVPPFGYINPHQVGPTIRFKKYALGYEVQQEVIDDDLYGHLMSYQLIGRHPLFGRVSVRPSRS